MKAFLIKYKKIVIITVIALLVLVIYFVKNPISKNNTIETTSSTVFNLDYLDEINIEELTSHGVPVIIDFRADYCQPCKQFDVVLEKIKDLYGDNIIIKMVDIEVHPELAEQYKIYAIPSQLFFNADGTPYNPTDEALKLNIETVYDDTNTDILYTKHTSASSYGKMMLFLDDMGIKQIEIEDGVE